MERTLFGPAPQENPLVIQPVWYAPIQFQRQGTPGNPTRGDRLFFEARLTDAPKEGSAWKGGRIGLATEAEVTRLKRISEILATAEPSTAAASILNGCGDADGQFAAWCLRLLAESERLALHERCLIHDAISKHVPPGTFVEECRLLLQNTQSPCIAYEVADHILAAEAPSDEMEQFRHECHLRRISDVIAHPPQGAGYFSREPELRHLLMFSYPPMSPGRRIEAIDKLRELVGPHGPERLRWLGLCFASNLLDPSSEELRREVFRFYRDFIPQDEKLGFSYCAGLRRGMETDSEYSKHVCTEGMDILSSMLVGGNARIAQSACGDLGRYSEYCRRQNIGWPDLAYVVRDLRDVTPHLESRNDLSRKIERWGVEKQTTD
ncbi:hypothetical protein [Blastopirellula sediminis]|uniref:hypothetical protein n=1 Tax=Blastopirellula sediminis TaxID=2894196 RepID=UPI001E2B81BF|nr:hypothetical protein [Blastopirellula sediminis]